MSDGAVTHATFTVERTYKAAPAKVFEALSDPTIKRQWFAARNNNELVDFESDFRPGGRQHLHYKFGSDSPFPGISLTDEAFSRRSFPVVASS